MAINIQIDPRIYNKVYRQYLDASIRNQIFYGGSSSGKSFFLAQRAVKDILSGGHNYLITRQVSTTLRSSVFNEIYKAIKYHHVEHLFHITTGDMVITCCNGYQILFKGLDDEEKIKSVTPIKGVITDIWQEEATENTYEATKQLSKRLRGKSKVPKRQILSFNPIYKTHWIYKTYFAPVGWADDQKNYQDDHLLILKTTYADNGFLEKDDIYELEHEENEYYRNVYTFGNWGILGDAIFTNWKTDDLSKIKDSFDRIRNGLDFGYSSDPNAYTRIHYDKPGMKIYIFEAWQARNLTNPMIAERLKPIIGREPIFCDSAEPKSITELQSEGIDARPVKKGKDSILHGIKWINKHETIIDKSLQGVVNEFNTYQWKKDKDGNALPFPVGDDHFIDSCRYATEVEHTGFFEGLI